MLERIPCQVQIRSAVQVQLIFKDLMHRVGRGSILGDLELGDLLPTRVARGIRGGARDGVADVGMMSLYMLGAAAKLCYEVIGVNLSKVSFPGVDGTTETIVRRGRPRVLAR